MAKRLIVCSDGTWNTPQERVTNVVRMARSIRPRDRAGTEQVVFYDWGVGTGDTLDRIRGGAFGRGLNKNILDAYRFLVHNYSRGDELFLFGFSRGAYTVRSLVGLIRNCGLLKRTEADRIPGAFELYRSDRHHPDSAVSRRFCAGYAYPAKVKFLGVWDTVGALGIPLKHRRKTRHSFHDTRISSIVRNAYHALAIDERRKPFRPTLWTTKPGRRNTEQAWFVGVHSDVGGGYEDHGLADRTFRWMWGKAKGCGLALNETYARSTLMKDPDDVLHNSFRGLYRALGPYARAIGDERDESVHPSVLARYRDPGQRYRPRNLKEYLQARGSAGA